MTLPAHEQIQTYHETIRQKTLIPRTSPETSNHSELCRNDPQVRVLNKASRDSARSLYWEWEKRSKLSSTILKIKSDWIMSNTNKQNPTWYHDSLMQQADIKDNYFHKKIQAIPLKNTSTSNLERNVTRDTRSRKWTHNPGSERQSAHWTTNASSFIPAARSGEPPTSSTVSAEDMEYSYWSSQSCIYFSKTNPINYDTHQENRTQLQQSNNYSPTPISPEIISPGIPKYNTIEQHFPIPQRSTFTRWCHIRFRKVFPSVEHSLQSGFNNAHNNDNRSSSHGLTPGSPS